MKRQIQLGHIMLVLFITTLFALPANAQGPLEKIRKKAEGGSSSDNLPRLPNDQVEGTIWEYKATPESKVRDGKKTNELKGKFRLEGKAIFAVSKRITVPKGGPKEIVSKIREGGEIKIPEGPQQKRLGEYRELSSKGKYRLDFDDKDSLHGIMIIWKKSNKSDVWMGTYKEMDGKKTTGEYVVELKPIED